MLPVETLLQICTVPSSIKLCVEVMTVCSEAGLFHQPASGSYLVVSAKSGPHLL